MEKNLSFYPDTSNGNRDLSIDAGNGTAYNTTNFSILNTGTKTLSFSTAINHIQNTKGEFSFGAKTQGEGASDNQVKTKTRPSEYAIASERPVLIVKYNLTAATESEGDAAIVQGILNAIPTATIHDSQQVYTRNVSGTQQLGRFDKLAVYGSQRWAFNYITIGESFMNMNNLSTTFFVLEMTDLTTSQITTFVENFINGTKA